MTLAFITSLEQAGEGSRGWRDEDHDPCCESRMYGRCDCSRYIVASTVRAFSSDLKQLIADARRSKGQPNV